ncbi:MAG: hypothetical protein GY811_02390 [Myxococcales bacterium]|nr:hypothetical protein [Myxococcales bacterium]
MKLGNALTLVVSSVLFTSCGTSIDGTRNGPIVYDAGPPDNDNGRRLQR